MSYRVKSEDVHQEEDNVPLGKVTLAIITALAVSAVLVIAAGSIVDSSYRAIRPKGAFPERTLGPRHPVARVRQDLFDERGKAPTARERARRALESFGVVDEARGIVTIPIERAMEIVEGEGR